MRTSLVFVECLIRDENLIGFIMLLLGFGLDNIRGLTFSFLFFFCKISDLGLRKTFIMTLVVSLWNVGF